MRPSARGPVTSAHVCCWPTSWAGTGGSRSPSGGPTSASWSSPPDEMIEAREPLGGLELIGVEDEARRTYRYRFPRQEFDIGSSPVNPANEKPMPVEEIGPGPQRDRAALPARSVRSSIPTALVPKTVIPTPGHEQRLLDIGSYVVEHGLAGRRATTAPDGTCCGGARRGSRATSMASRCGTRTSRRAMRPGAWCRSSITRAWPSRDRPAAARPGSAGA